MSHQSRDIGGIESNQSLETVELPADVAEQMATLYGTDGAPRTVRAWVDEVRAATEDALGRPPTVDDLCATDDGAHAFVGDDERQEYVCVLDPLAYAFLTGTPGTVRSTTPVRGADLAIEVGREAVTVPSGAVASIGVSDAVEGGATPTLGRVYRQACEYIHLFANAAEYEAWAADVDAATTSVPAETGVAIARELSAALFDHETPVRSENGDAADCC